MTSCSQILPMIIMSWSVLEHKQCDSGDCEIIQQQYSTLHAWISMMASEKITVIYATVCK